MIRPTRSDTGARPPHAGDGPDPVFLLLAGLPLVVWLLRDDDAGRVGALLVACLMIAALRLIARGQRVHRAYATAAEARAPRFPRKIAGAVLIGAAVAVLAGFRFDTLWAVAATGAVAAGLAVAVFGPDPLRDKRSAGQARARTAGLLGMVETTLAEAEARVGTLDEITLLHDVTAFADHVAGILHRASETDRARLEQMAPLLLALREDLREAVARLEEGDRGPFARRRFRDRLGAIRDTVDFRVGAIAEAAREPAPSESALPDLRPQFRTGRAA